MIKQVFGNRVVIDPVLEEEVTSTGIIVPSKKGQQKHIGKIIAVGKGLLLNNGERAPMDFKEGMLVIYKQYAGLQIQDGEESYLILDAGDIIAEVA